MNSVNYQDTEWFPINELPGIHQKIGELNSRLHKKGIPGRIHITEEFDDNNGVQVTIDATGLFSYDGWKIDGIYDFSINPTTPLRLGFPENYNHPDNIQLEGCQECHYSRFRKKLFVVSNGNERKLIGSTCIKDYTGHRLSTILDTWETVQKEWDTILHAETRGYDIQRYVASAIVITNRAGHYVRTDDTDGEPTRDQAIVLTGRGSRYEWQREVTDQIWEEAAQAIEWAKTYPGNSDFDVNLRAATSTSIVLPATAGILAYLPTAYKRSQDRKQIRVATPPVEEGKGMQITGVILKVTEYDSEYGYVTKVSIKTDTGNIVWGTLPRKQLDNTLVGDRVSFVANVAQARHDPNFGKFTYPRKWVTEAGIV